MSPEQITAVAGLVGAATGLVAVLIAWRSQGSKQAELRAAYRLRLYEAQLAIYAEIVGAGFTVVDAARGVATPGTDIRPTLNTLLTELANINRRSALVSSDPVVHAVGIFQDSIRELLEAARGPVPVDVYEAVPEAFFALVQAMRADLGTRPLSSETEHLFAQVGPTGRHAEIG